jgi:hypothetical protein
MEIGDLVAREAIRDVLARYTWAGDRGRSRDLADCFTPDGVLDVGEHGGRWVGQEEIVARLKAVAGGIAERSAVLGDRPKPVRHHVSSVVIDLTGATTATSSSYFFVLTEVGVDHWGRYQDWLEADDEGAWRIAKRVVRVDGRADASLMVTGPLHHSSVEVPSLRPEPRALLPRRFDASTP